ncbi:MAG: hypothetical protein ACOVQE_00040, partial [Chitinophagaceae bacterium]
MRIASFLLTTGIGLLAATQLYQWQSPVTATPVLLADTSKKDTTKFAIFKDLPLQPTRKIDFKTEVGSWMSIDVSPDGKTLAFDVMGDIYTMPITGGTATPVTKGMAYDVHPRFSPDGKKLLFISDRSGADNVWYIDMEKEDTVQLTYDVNQYFPNACWTPDGNYIIYSKGRRTQKLYMVHYKGGGGMQLLDGPPALKAIDPAVSADGNLVYYSARFGAWNYNALLPQYQLGVYNRTNGKTSSITSRYGSGFTPVLSKDGKWLVYGSRFEDKTGLVIRNLATGEEKWLAYPVQRDEQESIAPLGVLPAMAFTPDSKYLIASYGGKIQQIPIDGSAITNIPFNLQVSLELGPQLDFKYPVADTAFQAASQIRDAVPSPDGKKLAFTALNRLYVMNYPNGTPERVTKNEFTEAQPAWSPDGQSLVFVSWQPGGGHIHKVNYTKKGTQIQQLTTTPGLYQNLSFNVSGDRIVFVQSSSQIYKDAYGPGYDGNEDNLAWISANGGAIQQIDKAAGRFNPHFNNSEPDRIYLTAGGGTLVSIKWDGTDEKKHIKITGITTYGTIPTKMGRPDPEHMKCIMLEEDEATAQEREMQLPSPASLVSI